MADALPVGPLLWHLSQLPCAVVVLSLRPGQEWGASCISAPLPAQPVPLQPGNAEEPGPSTESRPRPSVWCWLDRCGLKCALPRGWSGRPGGPFVLVPLPCRRPLDSRKWIA